MAQWHIGVIGSSGLADAGALEQAQEIAVASAFGTPSGPVVTGELAGVRITLLDRHGAGHAIGPAQVNYRANIDVLKRCGVTDVVAFAPFGTLGAQPAPGALALAEQLIDHTHGRARSFFGDGIVAQLAFADPVCPRLSGLLAQAAGQCGLAAPQAVTCIALAGPHAPTRAEQALFRQWGAQASSLVAMPEALLAREAELPYALLGTVAGEAGSGDIAGDIGGGALPLLAALARLLPPQREASPIDRALDGAIITPRAHWAGPDLARLDAVAGRLINSG